MGFFTRSVGKATRFMGAAARIVGKSANTINHINRGVTKMTGVNPLGMLKNTINPALDAYGINEGKRNKIMGGYRKAKGYHNAYSAGNYAGLAQMGAQDARGALQNYHTPFDMVQHHRSR